MAQKQVQNLSIAAQRAIQNPRNIKQIGKQLKSDVIRTVKEPIAPTLKSAGKEALRTAIKGKGLRMVKGNQYAIWKAEQKKKKQKGSGTKKKKAKKKAKPKKPNIDIYF